MPSSPIVIVGAGHAGVQAAASLREDGFDGEIILLSDEKELPYQRPPLSKAFLKGEMDLHGLPLRAEAFFPRPAHRPQARRRARRGSTGRRSASRRATARRSATAISSWRPARDGAGSTRRASNCPASSSCAPSPTRPRIRERLGPGGRIVVIGAGFIGLEIAATARASGPT